MGIILGVIDNISDDNEIGLEVIFDGNSINLIEVNNVKEQENVVENFGQEKHFIVYN